MNDKVKKLSGELEVVKRKCATTDDKIIALTMVVKNSIEKEKVRQEKTDDYIRTQINNVKRELIEERGERDNECLMLNRCVRNLEEQLSAHVKELRFNHEAEVTRRSMAHEKLEQTHRELEGCLDARDANHLEAFTGMKTMIDQEIKAREKDTSNAERTFNVISARFIAESSKTSESINDLRDRLDRLGEELGREVLERTDNTVAVRALLAGTQQELGKEKDMRLAETNATWCNLQSLEGRLKNREEDDKALHFFVAANQQELSKEKNMRLAEATELGRRLQTLEGCLTQHLQDLKLSVDDKRSNAIMMHDRLAENLNQMKAAVDAQEILRLQATQEIHNKVKKLSGRVEAVQRECVAAGDETTALTTVMKYSIEKEKVERKNADNHINTQINKMNQKLTEHGVSVIMNVRC